MSVCTNTENKCQNCAMNTEIELILNTEIEIVLKAANQVYLHWGLIGCYVVPMRYIR